MAHEFFDNLDRLRLQSGQQMRHPSASKQRAAQFPSTRRVNGEFVKGPLPLNWLSIASKLRGKSPLAVALAILFEAGRRKSNEIVLTTAICERFGIRRKSKYRGLAALEAADLILVVRRPRKNPIVRVLEVSERPSTGQTHQRVSDGHGATQDSTEHENEKEADNDS